MKSTTWHRLAATALLAAMGTALATPAVAWDRYGAAVDVEVVSDRGTYLRQYPVSDRGDVQRAYLEARQGQRYSIRVRNLTNRRVGLVIAVDGRNIISGKRSHLKSSERMYILGPYERATYEGWRTGRDRVNRFYFTDVGDSYADAFGDRSAMGVIAVATFDEKRRRHEYHSHDDYRYGDSDRYRPKAGEVPEAQSKSRAAPSQKNGRSYYRDDSPGTGFGEGHYSPSRRVAFDAERRATERHFLKYEWRSTLCEKGIGACHDRNNRFWPGDYRDVYGFAPYPPNRRGHYRDHY